MNLKFIIIPIIVWVVGQSIKFLVYILKGGIISKKNVSWIYQWAGGSPSTHAAMLTSSLYLLGKYNGFDAIFGFAFVVALLLMYNLLADKKKQELFEKHLKNSKDHSLQKIVREGNLLDISGHTYFEVVSGVIFGLAASIILANLI